MLDTYKDIFTYFLDGIKKTYTGVVKPDVFVRLFNTKGLIEWTAENMSIKEGIELTQKQIDDLQALLVKEEVNLRHSNDNTLLLTTLKEKYRRLANIMVKVDYGSDKCNECGRKGISEWQRTFVRRANQIVYFRQSIFRRPSATNIYHQQIGDSIFFDTGGNTKVVAVKLEYFRYPREMRLLSATNVNTWNTSIYDDLNAEQKKEVLDKCVRLYLERVKDDRYRTNLYEDRDKDVTKI